MADHRSPRSIQPQRQGPPSAGPVVWAAAGVGKVLRDDQIFLTDTVRGWAENGADRMETAGMDRQMLYLEVAFWAAVFLVTLLANRLA